MQGSVTEARSCREEEKAAERKEEKGAMIKAERRGGSEVRGVKEKWGEGEKESG